MNYRKKIILALTFAIGIGSCPVPLSAFDWGALFNSKPNRLSSILDTALGAAITALVITIVWSFSQNKKNKATNNQDKSNQDEYTIPQKKLSNIAGKYPTLELDIDKIKHPEKYADLDSTSPHLLLYGPPGTGKTSLAQALAGNIDAIFIPVSSADIVSPYPGESQQNLADKFRLARHYANKCQSIQENSKIKVVLFFDEIDSLTIPCTERRNRSSAAQGHNMLVNQFKIELENDDNQAILVIGATNNTKNPDGTIGNIDPAITRNGRLSPREIPAPDQASRKEIAKYYFEKNEKFFEPNLINNKEAVCNLIALGTPGKTGADIQALFNDIKSQTAFANQAKVTLDQCTKTIKAEIKKQMDATLAQVVNANYENIEQHRLRFNDYALQRRVQLGVAQ